VVGLVGTPEQWAALDWHWSRFNCGTPFHANDCDSDQGDYSSRSHWSNKALYRDLAILLARSGLTGYGKAIDLIAKNNIFPEAEDLAYYSAFQRVIQAIREHTAASGEIAELTFDMRSESTHNAGFLYGSLRDNEPGWTPYLPSRIAFEFAKDNPRIQVADLFAREVMKALDNRIGPVKRKVRKSWRTLAATGRFRAEFYSVDWFQGLKRALPEAEKHMNMNRAMYLDWLRRRNRQHNVSNMFQFVDWTTRRDRHRNRSV
jgi:hypothetical protein